MRQNIQTPKSNITIICIDIEEKASLFRAMRVTCEDTYRDPKYNILSFVSIRSIVYIEI